MDELKQQETNATVEKMKKADGLNKKLLFICFAALLVIIALGITIYRISLNDKKEAAIVEQNQRLKGFTPSKNISPSKPELIEARKKLEAYAAKNNIIVSEEEITERQEKLIKESGEEKVGSTLAQYGWTMNDWRGVVRGQILIEKIIEKIRPSRSGEVLSIRWDAYSPVLNEEVANQRKVVAIEYLEKARELVVNGKESNFNNISKKFDINKEPIFKGLENKYAMQYSGWDELTSSYKQFLLPKNGKDYKLIMTAKPPTVTQVSCTLGGCLLYNITSGSDGDPKNSEILELITKEGIIF